MYGLDPRSLIAGLILGTAVALGFRGFATGHPRIARLAPRLTPLAALLPPVVVVLATWRPRGWELEGILRVGGVFYGPALVTVALVLLGLSRPFARRRGVFARIAQRPLFWILAPYAVAGGILGGLALVHPSDALAVGANATLTKTLTAHFTAGTVPAAMTSTGDQLALATNTTPSAATLTTHVTTGTIGDGSHTLQGPSGNISLIIRGGGSTATQYYDAATGTISATAGPTLPQAAGAGAYSISRSAATFLMVAGGASNKLVIIDPQGVAVGSGSCTVAYGVGCWTATLASFTLSGNAGAGAHAIRRSVDGKILLVHGGGLKTSTVYTPPSGTEGVVAGPATTANVGAGALSVPRTADASWVTFVGGNSKSVNLYTPGAAGTIGSFAAYGGTLPANNLGAGAHALKYVDSSAGKCTAASAASATCWLIIQGAGAGNAIKYDPALATNQALTTVVAVGANVTTGGHSFLRGDGTFLTVIGASTTTRVWTPSTAAFTAGPTLSVGSSPGAGAHSFQRQNDGAFVVVGTTTTVTNGPYAAGWAISATYTSESLNPGYVDRWDQASWTVTAPATTGVVFGVATATSTNGVCGVFSAFTTYDAVSAATTGAQANSGIYATGNRCVQAQVTLTRPVPRPTDANSTWGGVSFGERYLVFDRTPVATPTLVDYSLRMVLGQFTVGATGPRTAGTAFTSSITLTDQSAATISDYTGAHTLVLSGANRAPDGTAPTIADANVTDQPFGGLTTETFTNGAYTAANNMKLYKTETTALAATESVTPAATTSYICPGGVACVANAGFALTSNTTAIVVQPAALSVNTQNGGAGWTTSSPTVASLASGTVRSVTVTAFDLFKNPIPNQPVTLASVPAGPTIVQPANTDASGVATGTIATSTLGTYTVTATVNGTAVANFPLNATWVSTTAKEASPTTLKDTQARLASNATLLNTTVAASGAQLNASNAASASTGVGTSARGLIGGGGHTVQGNNGQYLVIHGNDGNTSSLYDGAGAFTDGPAIADSSGPIRANFGAHSFLVTAGSNSGRFLLLPGGQGFDTTATKTLLLDPAGWTVSDGPVTLPNAGAGAGAFTIAFSNIPGQSASDPRYLIVLAGGILGGPAGTATTAIFDASTNTVVTGPSTTAAVGEGAFGIVRSNGTVLIVHGNRTTGSSVFTPAASPGIGSMAAGPALAAQVARGGHAIQYNDGSIAGSPLRYLIVHGGAPASTTTTSKYDPVGNAFAAGPALTTAAGIGAFSLQRAAGDFLVASGDGGTATSIFTPSTATMAAGPALSGAVGAGGHVLQQTDHTYLILRGNLTNQTTTYDAGWIGKGTYASEWTDPGNVDSYTTLGYTTALSGASITLSLQVAQTNAGTNRITAQTAAAVNGTSSVTLPLGSTSDRKWARAVATLIRPVPQFSGEQKQVWLGASMVVYSRAQTATPVLSSLGFGYRSGYFRITAATPQVAGVPFATTGFALVDDTSTGVASAVITEYAGTHTLVFSGAGTAPNGTSVPTARNASAVDVAFGTNTTLAFTAGAAGTTLTLYKAETALPAADETVNGQACPSPQACTVTSGTTIGTLAPSIRVDPANPDAAQSTASVSPATVPADDVALSTLSIVVKDAFQNRSPGVNAAYRAVTITRTGSAVIAAATGNVDATGAYSTTVRDAVAQTVTLTIQISSGADAIPTITLTAQPQIVFASLTLALTVVDAGGTPIAGPTVTAGQSFGLRIEAQIVSPPSTDTTFCNGAGSTPAKCDLTFTTTAGAAPDGTGPRVTSVTLSAVTFSSGFYTTSASFALVCANGSGVVCLTQTGTHTITATATQVGQIPPPGEPAVALTGTSPGITVNPAKTNSRNGFDANAAVQSFVLVSPTAVGVTATAGVPTTVSAWARVVDGFGNAAESGRTVTFATTLGTLGTTTAPTSASAAGAVYGFAGPVTLTSASAGTATLSATVSDNNAAAQNATAYFFTGIPRISNGTYYGTLSSTNGAAPASGPVAGLTGVPLAVVATDGTGKPALSVSGTALAGSTACWTTTGNATGGAFDAAAGTCAGGVTTTSGAVLAGQVAIANGGRVTYWKAAQPGQATLHAVAGNATFDYTLTVAGYFRVATTTTPNGRLVTALVDWDGTTAKVIGWFAPEP